MGGKEEGGGNPHNQKFIIKRSTTRQDLGISAIESTQPAR